MPNMASAARPSMAVGTSSELQTPKPCDGFVGRAPDLIVSANIGLDEGGFGSQTGQLGLESLALCFPPAGNEERGTSLANAAAAARPMPIRAPIIKTAGLFMALLPLIG
jgi:hypothetical protein